MKVIIFLLLTSSCYGVLWLGRRQAVGVKGKLLCDGKPAEGVKVKLYEKEPCYQKVPIEIPSKYIVDGDSVPGDKYFDIGVLELSMEFRGQTTDCIN
ncbi:Transthyretin-like family protein [Ancylostoma ceylanicum]|uniref:Transthyretin-like family protein n=1 Tax=Ancylostoma ceylanicum TaxID=53326 RepID=A0A0D6LIY7_9BILA|nr:Transthyretin-like family protein [Ancylostoma ceylanicum]